MRHRRRGWALFVRGRGGAGQRRSRKRDWREEFWEDDRVCEWGGGGAGAGVGVAAGADAKDGCKADTVQRGSKERPNQRVGSAAKRSQRSRPRTKFTVRAGVAPIIQMRQPTMMPQIIRLFPILLSCPWTKRRKFSWSIRRVSSSIGTNISGSGCDDASSVWKGERIFDGRLELILGLPLQISPFILPKCEVAKGHCIRTTRRGKIEGYSQIFVSTNRSHSYPQLERR